MTQVGKVSQPLRTASINFLGSLNSADFMPIVYPPEAIFSRQWELHVSGNSRFPRFSIGTPMKSDGDLRNKKLLFYLDFHAVYCQRW